MRDGVGDQVDHLLARDALGGLVLADALKPGDLIVYGLVARGIAPGLVPDRNSCTIWKLFIAGNLLAR